MNCDGPVHAELMPNETCVQSIASVQFVIVRDASRLCLMLLGLAFIVMP